MKTIGLIGGLGPESTVDYYKSIIHGSTGGRPDPVYPEIIIYSVNMTEVMAMVTGGNRGKLTDFLLGKIGALHRAGAELGAIASNTPHIVFDEVAARSPIPLVSIVEATLEYACTNSLKRCGLMGTATTMANDFYRKAFDRRAIEVVMPSEKEQQLIHHRIFSEIEIGIFNDSTREELLAITRRMIADEGIDALILGCTELPLILTGSAFSGIPFLNTTAIHCRKIVESAILHPGSVVSGELSIWKVVAAKSLNSID